MSLSGIVLGLINIGIVVAILLLVGAVVLWFMGWMGIGVPGNVQKGYIAVVALIALYMIVALLFGIPSVRIIGHGQSNYPAVGAVMPPVPAIMREN